MSKLEFFQDHKMKDRFIGAKLSVARKQLGEKLGHEKQNSYSYKKTNFKIQLLISRNFCMQWKNTQ